MKYRSLLLALCFVLLPLIAQAQEPVQEPPSEPTDTAAPSQPAPPRPSSAPT